MRGRLVDVAVLAAVLALAVAIAGEAASKDRQTQKDHHSRQNHQPRVHHRRAAPPVRLLPPPPRSRLLSQHGKPVSPTPFFRSGFTFKADGYKLGVSTFGSAVFIEVWRGGRGKRVATSYLARGVARPERLQATFGNFGKVKMRFRPSRHRTWVGQRRTCRGANRFIKRHGIFRGNLRFKGEGGYVNVRIHRAKGAVVVPAPKCLKHRRRGPGPGFEFNPFKPRAGLLSVSREGIDSTAFLALEGRHSTQFFASTEDSRPHVAIVRIAVLRKHSPIRIDEALTTAKLSPPAPFHGTGRYRAYSDGTNSWSGDLSINFPGAPRFPLTGPTWETFLEVPF
jgi:hypothetical protein